MFDWTYMPASDSINFPFRQIAMTWCNVQFVKGFVSLFFHIGSEWQTKHICNLIVAPFELKQNIDVDFEWTKFEASNFLSDKIRTPKKSLILVSDRFFAFAIHIVSICAIVEYGMIASELDFLKAMDDSQKWIYAFIRYIFSLSLVLMVIYPLYYYTDHINIFIRNEN